MIAQNDLNKPLVALCLDIDGVLGQQPFSPIHKDNIKNKINELAGNIYHYNKCKDCNMCKEAEAHLFKKEVIDCLNELINKITAIANLHIIIVSTWRLKRTVEDLKNIFSMHDFSKYIFDKTDDDNVNEFEEWKDYCAYPHIKITIENIMEHFNKHPKDITKTEIEGFILKNCECRASQINRWIKEHPEYSGFIILDDLDEHLSENFGDKFISTDHHKFKILKPEDCEIAYQSILEQLKINI